MGFTFDTYVSRSQWESYSESDRCNLLLRALVLEDDAVETYQKDMQKLPDAVHQMSDEDLLAECTERQKLPATRSPITAKASMQPSPQTMQTSSFSVCHGRKAGQQKSTANQLLLKRQILALWQCRLLPATAKLHSPITPLA